MNYKVTYAIDSLDDEVQHRIDYTVQHSPYTISEKEYQEIEEYEYSLVRLEKVESKKVELINDDLFGETITGYSIY